MKHVDTVVRRLDADLETKTSELFVAHEAFPLERGALLSRIIIWRLHYKVNVLIILPHSKSFLS